MVVKVHAWATNPANVMVQDIPLPFIKYPLILGEDVTGTVERVGSTATPKFQPGDRVFGLALGAAVANLEQSAF
jgi:NADPH:quinone reductase-like Zn-dependent oxidoreductase